MLPNIILRCLIAYSCDLCENHVITLGTVFLICIFLRNYYQLPHMHCNMLLKQEEQSKEDCIRECCELLAPLFLPCTSADNGRSKEDYATFGNAMQTEELGGAKLFATSLQPLMLLPLMILLLVGSSIEPRLAIDHKSENGTEHVLSCGSQPARAEKRKRLKRFGHGFEATIHHAINMPETPCK